MGDGGIYDHIVEYDVRNRRTFVRDSLNASKLCEYDARGLVTRIVDGEGRATKFEHDERSLAESAVVAPDGHRIERDYDAHGNVVSIRDGEMITSIAYDGRRPIRLVDPRGSEWTWRYDLEGHLVEHVTPDGSRSTLEWRDGLLVALEESVGGRVTFEHDARRLVSAVVLSPGEVIRTEHDELGRIAKVSSPRGSAMRTQRDAEGRPIASWSLAGVESSASYDAEGHLLASESSEQRRHFEIGPGHRVVGREEAGALVRYEYDTECRLIAVVNEAGERYALELNRVGETIAEVGFDGARRAIRRDVCGRPTKVVHASGRTSEHAYQGGRLSRVTHSDGSFVRFEHDRYGDMTIAENESARVEISYDRAGRVVSERVNGEEVRSDYANGQRVQFTTSRGARMSWLPDARGNVERVFFGSDVTPGMTIERDAMGVERARRFSNGIDHTWTRDDAGRATVRRTFARYAGQAGLDAASAWLRGSFGPAPKSEVETIAYTWMGDDELARLVDSASGAREYERDARGRLVRETQNGALSPRALDAVGNICRALDESDREYASGGRLVRREGVHFEHDADGQRLRETDDDGAAWSYQWNGHGLLREVLRPDGVRVSFTYDAFARRIGKRTLSADGATTKETRFVWDGNGVVHEDGSETGLTTWYWHPEDGSLLARERDGERWSVAVDHLGTPTEMHDARGELAWQMRLDAWGAADVMVGSADDCAWRWPGQYEDGETGLYYNRHRYYSPDDGRYISLDPIRLEGGLALYAYVEDPTGWIDPDGLRPLDQPGFMLYHIVNRRTNEVRYVGITDNISVRRQAHIDSGRLDLRRYRIDVQERGLTYAQVRGYEQADIGFHQTRRTGRIGEPIVAGDWNRVWSYAQDRTDSRAVAFRIFEEERRAYNNRGGCRS